ncbi:MAG: hypothetical protein R3A78_10540 [Polyangiales bacterium]|nr:hypothetical protein [Myxococcales bacterium]
MRTRTVAFGVLLVLAGCGSSLPALTDAPMVPDGPSGAGDADEKLRDRMNRELGNLYDDCSEARDRLSDEVSDAANEDVLLGVAAVGAATAGQAASSEDNIQNQNWSRDGQPQNNGNTVPSRSVKRSAEDQIAAINAAIDELSSYLLAHPNVSLWSESEVTEYNRLRRRVHAECK